jgi:cyclomaltodextrinase / maltogenic alpha-amylase / neopullulanase
MSLPLGRYRHFKGNEYEVIGVARDSESKQEFVVYRALYGERGLWIRPLSMFTEEVERDGRRQPRFTFVVDAPDT